MAYPDSCILRINFLYGQMKQMHTLEAATCAKFGSPSRPVAVKASNNQPKQNWSTEIGGMIREQRLTVPRLCVATSPNVAKKFFCVLKYLSTVTPDAKKSERLFQKQNIHQQENRVTTSNNIRQNPSLNSKYGDPFSASLTSDPLV